MRGLPFSVATGLWPVRSESAVVTGRLTEPWLQELCFAICAASSKQSGGITGKILSTRLDGITDITIKPPRLQQNSQKVPGHILRNAAPMFHRRDARSKIAMAISRMLHGANLW